jgi:signal transduction histidine kinase/CheY-like chemotaxis protein
LGSGGKQDAELRRLNRAYRALCLCHDHLVRATSERALLDAVCKCFVEAGGYRLAWVGYAENEPRRVRPVAVAGPEADRSYVNDISITWADDELGRGPTGTAIRIGEPSINRDSETNPTYGPWKEEALRHRYRSSIALPLLSERTRIGALMVYADVPDAFDTEECSLLTRFAESLAYGIVALRARRERAIAEEALRDSEAHVRAVLASLAEAVALFGPDGPVLSINQSAHRLLGRFLKEIPSSVEMHGPVRGAPTTDVAPPEPYRLWQGDGSTFPAAQWPWIVAQRSGEAVRDVEMGFPDSDGAVQWMSVNAQPVRDPSGRVLGTVVSFFDITARRRTEVELRDAERRKNEFLAMLSHEIRNPLAAIRTSSYILEHAPVTEQGRRALAVVDRQTVHMSRLLDDLLDVTRMTLGKITLRPESVELNALVERSAEDYREEFMHSGVELHLRRSERPLMVYGDPTRLAQVVGNLLSNAVRFTPRGGHVEATIEASGPDHALLSVRDDGVGIAPEVLPRIFEPFVQAPQGLQRELGGLGLGLALVKGLVEMHGGTVRAESAGLGCGARLSVTLPLAESTRPGEHSACAEGPPHPALRVLVIEDNPDLAESLEIALSMNEHSVAVASTGPEGVEKARALKPDVVLCDIGLPGLDGYGVARAIHSDPELSGTYLVAVSGYALPEDIRRCREAGFARHIPKPADFSLIAEILAEVPARSSAT